MIDYAASRSYNARFYSLRFLQRLRLKRWDYYGLTTPDHFFIEFKPNTSLGNLDWGRGVSKVSWNFCDFWVTTINS